MEGCRVCVASHQALRSCMELAQRAVVPGARYNLTGELRKIGAAPWLLRLAMAVAAIWECAAALRIIQTAQHDGLLPEVTTLGLDWSVAWCGFLCMLRTAVLSFPAAGLTTTALNRSAVEIVLEEFPGALTLALQGLADGTVGWEEASKVVQNATQVFLEYIDDAVLLGEEAVEFGRSRVWRAVFHGDAAAAGWVDERISRGDVLSWLLRKGDLNGSRSARHGAAITSPNLFMVELGVNLAHVSDFLLRRHPSLRWLGVDPYEGQIWTPGGEAVDGLQVRKVAQARLAPYGRRAQLVIARSSDPRCRELGPKAFDLLFVDALHDEASALADLQTWAPRVRPGGIVAGHDYRRHFTGVVRAAHRALPQGVTLHLAPDGVFWWRKAMTEERLR